MDSMVPHYPQTGGPPDKGLISDATGTMFAETPAPGESVQDQINALSAKIAELATFLEGSTYRIVYDANGGEDAPVDNNFYFTGGTAPILPSSLSIREGYECLGYAFTSDAVTPTELTEIPIEDMLSEIAPDHIITLYAVWEEVEADDDDER